MIETSPQKIPQHIAVIMDGNGRWAERRGLDRVEGHRTGAEAARRFVKIAADAGVRYLTLFSFSAENWKRPAYEVNALMGLLRLYLKKETAELHKAGACLKVIGDRSRLSSDIIELIEHAEGITRDNAKITVIIALSYGGRQDIAYAAKTLAEKVKQGELSPQDIDETALTDALMTKGIPDPDLLIRTSGEYRVSNFLMWQMAYTELFFTDTYWPDFDQADFDAAVAFFNTRERRFGGLPKTKDGGSSL